MGAPATDRIYSVCPGCGGRLAHWYGRGRCSTCRRLRCAVCNTAKTGKPLKCPVCQPRARTEVSRTVAIDPAKLQAIEGRLKVIDTLMGSVMALTERIEVLAREVERAIR